MNKVQQTRGTDSRPSMSKYKHVQAEVTHKVHFLKISAKKVLTRMVVLSCIGQQLRMREHLNISTCNCSWVIVLTRV